MSDKLLMGRRWKPGSRGRSAGMAFLLALGLGLPCPGQHQVTLKSGSMHECRIVGFADGIFTIEFPDGTRRQASQANIASIQFEGGAPSPLPPEFGLIDAPVPESAPPAPAARPAPTSRLKLASNWESRLGRGNLSIGDAARLLSKCGTPQIDLEGKATVIWGNLTYLMPLQEARKILNLGMSQKTPMTCAALPPSSFFHYAFSGNFEDGFNRLYLITDFADQIVGVQLQDNTSRAERWLPPYTDAYSAEWSLYNFANDRRKANPDWLIGFYVCAGSRTIMGYPPRGGPMNPSTDTGVGEGVVRVDSDLVSVNYDRYHFITETKSRERNRLLVAQPVVDLMLYIGQKSR
jgi:hypothetical protein